MNPSAPIPLDVRDELAVLPQARDLPTLLSGAAPGGYCALAPRRMQAVPASVQSRCGGVAPPWWRRDRQFVSSALHVFYLSEAFLIPEAGVIVSAEGHVMASSYAEAKYLYGSLAELPGVARAQDGSAQIAPNESTPVFSKTLATMPWGAIHNYGHFLLDNLPAAALFQKELPNEGWKFLFPRLKAWHRGHLDLLNVVRREELSQSVVFCRDVLWTNQMDHHLQHPNDSLQGLRAAYAPQMKTGEDKIWLSRAGDRKRRFAANEELETKLAELGFRILKPESLTPVEQVQAFSAAGIVAGFTGAAFANVLFCNPGARIVEIQPSLMPGVWVRNLASAIGCEWIPYFCSSSPSPQAAVIGGQERKDIGIEIALDLEDFYRFLGAELEAAKTLPPAGDAA